MSTDKIQQLEKEHATLDYRIGAMERTGIYEDLTLQELKRRRLAVKDQLSQLRRDVWESTQTIDLDDVR